MDARRLRTPSLWRQGQRAATKASVAAIARATISADFVARHFQREGSDHRRGRRTSTAARSFSALLDQVFGDLARRRPARGIDGAEIAEAHARAMTARWSSANGRWPQSVVTFGQIGLFKRDDPDWYAALVLNDILGGGGFRGRLMNEIREKRGLAYGVSTDLVPVPPCRAGSSAMSRPRTSRVGESIALVRAEWQRMRDQDGPTDSRAARRRQDLSDRLVPAQPRPRPATSPRCWCNCRSTGSASIISIAAPR